MCFHRTDNPNGEPDRISGGCHQQLQGAIRRYFAISTKRFRRVTWDQVNRRVEDSILERGAVHFTFFARQMMHAAFISHEVVCDYDGEERRSKSPGLLEERDSRRKIPLYLTSCLVTTGAKSSTIVPGKSWPNLKSSQSGNGSY